MIKKFAKRNNRQNKKLRKCEWTQKLFEIKFKHSLGIKRVDELTDLVYEIAEHNNCWMFGYFHSSDGEFAFHNEGLIDQGYQCLTALVSAISSFDESVMYVEFEEKDLE